MTRAPAPPAARRRASARLAAGRRAAALLAALAALLAAGLAAAVPASADTFTVASAGDASDAVPGDGACDPNGDAVESDCTLRAAIEEANANAADDSIGFSVATVDVVGAPLVAGAGCLAGCAVAIDGAGAVTIRWSGPVGPALQLADAADGSSLARLRLERAGAGAGALLHVDASSVTLAELAVAASAATGVAVRGAAEGVSLSGSVVSGSAGDGILVADSARSVSISTSSVSGSGGDGIRVTGSARTVSVSGSSVTANAGDGIQAEATTEQITVGATTVSGNGGDGVTIAGRRVVVTRSPIFANAIAPIALTAGANDGVTPPGGLRVGPRRADGSLPITGSTPGGIVELFRGDPRGSAPIALIDEVGVGAGEFAYATAPEPAPGDVVAATFRDSRGTSAFATATVPGDVVSPDLAGAMALSTSEVRLQLSEPVDPASVAPGDFALEMAGQPRTVTDARVEGATVVLTSSGWTHGEAGFVSLAAPGAVTDTSGNASLAATRVRVLAAPGDVLAPIGSSLAIRPRRICLTKSRRCRRTGATVTFLSSEAGTAELVIQRGDRRIGVDRTPPITVGRNSVRFTGRVGGRKLRPGSYRMLLYIVDAVGNRTIEPPLQRFDVARTTPPRRTRGPARRR